MSIVNGFTAQKLAEGFVAELLASPPEFLDVAEYVDETIDGDDVYEELYTQVHAAVIAELDTLAQRYGDDS